MSGILLANRFNKEIFRMHSRRDFLKRASLIALAPTVPGFLARTARAAVLERDGRVLVVIQLDGGNHGINTVVPFKDEGYAKARDALRLPIDRLHKVTQEIGLHPAMGDAAKLLEQGRLAIVQGVGYPNPSRSHFNSMAIWQAARLDAADHDGSGWLGRGLDGAARGASSLFIGSGPPPLALRGRRAVASALERLDDFKLNVEAEPRRAMGREEPGDEVTAFVRRTMLDAYAAADRLAEVGPGDSPGGYFGTPLSRQLQLVARLFKIGMGSRVFYVIQGGYDTHSRQLPAHATLLGDLSRSLRAFLDDLAAAKLAERVAVLCFSEFGRRVQENGSAGTDHGTAGSVFLAGPGVQAGLAGETPSLTDLAGGDLKMGIDFRRVYATVLEDWLGLSAKQALGVAFERLPLFRSLR
jgi:uncharacterized protein (DUF1501 family)